MWTYSCLLALAVILTVVSFRWSNLLLSFVGTISWIAIWAYHKDYPPTNIVIGSFIHEVLLYVYIILAIVTFLLYFRNRGQAKNLFNANTDKEGQSVESNVTESRSIMNLSDSEYRSYIRARSNRRNIKG